MRGRYEKGIDGKVCANPDCNNRISTSSKSGYCLSCVKLFTTPEGEKIRAEREALRHILTRSQMKELALMDLIVKEPRMSLTKLGYKLGCPISTTEGIYNRILKRYDMKLQFVPKAQNETN